MQLEVGTIIEGKVSSITNFGAFIDMGNGSRGMIHISEISNAYVKNVRDYLKIGQVVKAQVVKINEKGEVALSMKKLEPLQEKVDQKTSKNKFNRIKNNSRRKSAREESNSFESLMSAFKRKSEDKISDLRRTTESKRGSSHKRGSQR